MKKITVKFSNMKQLLHFASTIEPMDAVFDIISDTHILNAKSVITLCVLGLDRNLEISVKTNHEEIFDTINDYITSELSMVC